MRILFAIVSFLVLISTALTYCLYINHCNLEKRTRGIEIRLENQNNGRLPMPPFKYDNWTATIDSLHRQIDLRDIKQQYYMTQMDIQSNWFILFVTILFGVFAVVGYGFFVAQIQAITHESERQKKAQNEHIEKVEKRFKQTQRDILIAHSRASQIRRDEFTKNGKYFEAIKSDYEVIGLLKTVLELDDNSEDSNVLMLLALKEYLCHLEKMYEIMSDDKNSMFFYYAHDTPQLTEYFNSLYGKVYDPSKEVILKIQAQLQKGFAKARELRPDPQD